MSFAIIYGGNKIVDSYRNDKILTMQSLAKNPDIYTGFFDRIHLLKQSSDKH